MNTPIIDLEELLDEAKDRIEEKLIIEGELKNEYEKIEELVKKSGVVCQVELECHYNPVTVRFKELVKSGKMGKIYSFNARNTTLSPVWAFPWQGVPEESYGKRVSLCAGNPRFRGGALCDHPHIFDMIREVTGSEFEFVFARQAPNLRADIEVEDIR